MSNTFSKILELILVGDVRISNHGYDELVEDGILVKDIMKTAHDGQIVEDYPDYPKGPCVLVLQRDMNGNPIHVLWGIPRGFMSPAVLITAYKPDPKIWMQNFTRRRK